MPRSAKDGGQYCAKNSVYPELGKKMKSGQRSKGALPVRMFFELTT